MQTQRPVLVSALVIASAALALSACSRQDNATVGQKVDSAIAKVEQKADQAVADVKQGASIARAEAGQAADTAGDKVKDAAITTSINAELVRDSTLSATKIDVDTTNGRVALRGMAPDGSARERATQLAQSVQGVVSVDNQLTIGSK